MLLVLLAVLIASGIGGLLSGAARLEWVLWLHSAASYGVLLVLGWKMLIIVNSLRRRRLNAARIAFIGLTALLLATLATGYWWTNVGPAYTGGRSILTWHGLLAMVVFGLLVWHVVARRWVLRVPHARDRRALLRLAAVGAAGLALHWVIEPTKRVLALPGAQRRFTGSYETGSLTGQFPPTIWLFDNPSPIDIQQWHLQLDGLVDQPANFSYGEVEALVRQPLTALIDCTGGWYSTQAWQGVPLAALLGQAGVQAGAQSVIVRSVTGYARAFSLDDAQRFMLATHVAGAPLGHEHGAPVRLVAPNHRGFEWIKWITHIEVSAQSHLLQPPVPLQ